MSRFCSVVGGLPVAFPMGGFEPSFFSPGAGGTRPGADALVEALLVGELEPALDFDFPPQPAAASAQARSSHVHAEPSLREAEPRIDRHLGEEQTPARER